MHIANRQLIEHISNYTVLIVDLIYSLMQL